MEAVSPETRGSLSFSPFLPSSVQRCCVRMFCYGSEDGREPSLGQTPASEGVRMTPTPRVTPQTAAMQETAFCVLWATHFLFSSGGSVGFVPGKSLWRMTVPGCCRPRAGPGGWVQAWQKAPRDDKSNSTRSSRDESPLLWKLLNNERVLEQSPCHRERDGHCQHLGPASPVPPIQNKPKFTQGHAGQDTRAGGSPHSPKAQYLYRGCRGWAGVGPPGTPVRAPTWCPAAVSAAP